MEVTIIEGVSTIIGGGTPSTKIEEYYCKNGIAWLSPKDLSNYGWRYIEKGRVDITRLGLQKSSAKLMPKGTILFSSRAPIGYMAIAENEICTNQGFKSLVPNKSILTEYLFQFLKFNTEQIKNIATGSTFAEISSTMLKNILIIKPPTKILGYLELKVKLINNQNLLNQKQTQVLIKLRDTLLPKLISFLITIMNF
ncbi:restriction endonuclease subunit S [Isorropodon fossajaponicum symbiont]|uniref:restriction endonuclease subunit S n=1 Tax=Isorropodon fossajaponicum symbiont TaxID=883811 RepID=UPI001915C04A|nr:restriction endonuclease subunit S [Isorropodon fossajaponicum symbiont]